MVDTTTGDSEVSYLGTQELETLESTNDWEGKAEFSHVFKISTDDGTEKGDDSKENPFSASITGTVSIKAAINVKLRVNSGDKAVSVSLPLTENFDLKGTVEFKKELLKFPEITVPIYGCLSVGFEPQFVFKADASVSFNMSSTQTVGFEWSEKNGTQDISEAPVTSINFKLSGSVYLGFDLCPKAKLGAGKVSLLELKFKAEAGFEISGEERLGNQGTGQDEIHSCTNCYEAEFKFKLTFGIGLKILFYEPKIDLSPFSYSFGKAYASADYGDFGWGACPHVKYRLTLKAGETGAGATVKIQSNDSSTSSLVTETTLDADGNSTIYLPAREYLVIANKGNMGFTKTFSLSKALTLSIDLKQESTGGNPGTIDPSKPDITEPEVPDGGTTVTSGECGASGNNLTWKIDSNDVLTIDGVGAMKNYDFSSTGRAPWATNNASIKYIVVKPGVTTIGSCAFDGCKNVISVELPASLQSIEKAAFVQCSSLESIEIPFAVTDIGDGAFAYCGNLKKVKLPEALKIIGKEEFIYCSKLESITIPEHTVEIGENAFYNCKTLENVQLNAGIVRINDCAFRNCSSLKYAEIPESVTYLGVGVFQECVAMENVKIPQSIKNLSFGTFYNCVLLKNVIIPEGVVNIWNYAFYGCKNLEQVSIPKSVKTVEMNAFDECKKLEAVQYAGTTD
mgnify:FL=1